MKRKMNNINSGLNTVHTYEIHSFQIKTTFRIIIVLVLSLVPIITADSEYMKIHTFELRKKE